MTEGPEAGVARSLEKVRALVRVWDEAIRIPGLGWQVGLDALIGLIPGVGDLIGTVVAFYPVVEAARIGAGPAILLRMALNVAIDAAVGVVPLIGDLFDVGWKANRRNYDLLERWVAAPAAARRSSRVVVAGTVAVAAAAVVGVGWLIVAAFRAIVGSL